MLNENYTQHISNVNLTDHQKMVLAMAVTSGGVDEPSRVVLGDAKLVSARGTLDDLGLIEYSHETDLIQITPNGVKSMIQDNIIDDSNQLTQSGQEYASGKVPGEEVTTEQCTFKQYLSTL